MTKILLQIYGGPNGEYDSLVIDSNKLGEAWRDFYLFTNFCRIGLYETKTNNDGLRPRVRQTGWVYAVTANKRAIVYDSRYDTQGLDFGRFQLTRDFVRYVFAMYKNDSQAMLLIQNFDNSYN